MHEGWLYEELYIRHMPAYKIIQEFFRQENANAQG